MASTDGLQEPFKSQVEALLKASNGKVVIESGWRSLAEQQQLYARYQAGQGPLAAVPGTSKHECGLAVDFGPTSALPLVAQLAPQFGLVRTVPSEAWHYEPTYAAGKPCGAATSPQGTFTDTSGQPTSSGGGYDLAATASDLAGCAGMLALLVTFGGTIAAIVLHVHLF